MAPCRCIAAFAFPVVPEVYNQKASGSAVVEYTVSSGGAAAIASTCDPTRRSPGHLKQADMADHDGQ
jgi:hypothetical protein